MSVGSSADPLEHEADRVAVDVVEAIRRAEATSGPRDVTAALAPAGRIRRSALSRDHQSATSADGDAGTFAGGDAGPVGADVEHRIRRAVGRGQPMDVGTSSRMEHGFGADFSSVRVHTGPEADDLNRSLDARAFTVGSDVFFASGQYQPHRASGQRLLAHELAHTIQQRGGAVPSDGAERVRRSASAPPRSGREMSADRAIVIRRDNWFTRHTFGGRNRTWRSGGNTAETKTGVEVVGPGGDGRHRARLGALGSAEASSQGGTWVRGKAKAEGRAGLWAAAETVAHADDRHVKKAFELLGGGGLTSELSASGSLGRHGNGKTRDISEKYEMRHDRTFVGADASISKRTGVGSEGRLGGSYSGPRPSAFKMSRQRQTVRDPGLSTFPGAEVETESDWERTVRVLNALKELAFAAAELHGSDEAMAGIEGEGSFRLSAMLGIQDIDIGPALDLKLKGFAGAKAIASGKLGVDGFWNGVFAEAAVQAKAGAEGTAAVTGTLNGPLTVAVTGAIEGQAGAFASADASGRIGLSGVEAAASFDAFAGARATGSVQGRAAFRGRQIITSKASAGVNAGVGLSGGAKGALKAGKIGFGASGIVATALGMEAGVEGEIDMLNAGKGVLETGRDYHHWFRDTAGPKGERTPGRPPAWSDPAKAFEDKKKISAALWERCHQLEHGKMPKVIDRNLHGRPPTRYEVGRVIQEAVRNDPDLNPLLLYSDVDDFIAEQVKKFFGPKRLAELRLEKGRITRFRGFDDRGDDVIEDKKIGKRPADAGIHIAQQGPVTLEHKQRLKDVLEPAFRRLGPRLADSGDPESNIEPINKVLRKKVWSDPLLYGQLGQLESDLCIQSLMHYLGLNRELHFFVRGAELKSLRRSVRSAPVPSGPPSAAAAAAAS